VKRAQQVAPERNTLQSGKQQPRREQQPHRQAQHYAVDKAGRGNPRLRAIERRARSPRCRRATRSSDSESGTLASEPGEAARGEHSGRLLSLEGEPKAAARSAGRARAQRSKAAGRSSCRPEREQAGSRGPREQAPQQGPAGHQAFQTPAGRGRFRRAAVQHHRRLEGQSEEGRGEQGQAENSNEGNRSETVETGSTARKSEASSPGPETQVLGGSRRSSRAAEQQRHREGAQGREKNATGG